MALGQMFVITMLSVATEAASINAKHLAAKELKHSQETFCLHSSARNRVRKRILLVTKRLLLMSGGLKKRRDWALRTVDVRGRLR
jgi:hypothetical protein